MTIILDFDDVLFDTLNFKKSLARIFRKFGADFFKDYNKAKTKKGVYSLKNHLVLIKKENKEINLRQIKKEINKLFANTQKFLFYDVYRFLKNFKNNTLILISWGGRDFQKKKIYGLGSKFISPFDKIIIGPVEKAAVLKRVLRLYKSKPVIFIDNSQKELENIKDKFKDIVLIRIKRGCRRQSLSDDYIELVNLKEAKKLLKSYGQYKR